MSLSDLVFFKSQKALDLKVAFRLFLDEKEEIVQENGIPFVYHYYNPQVHVKSLYKRNTSPLLPPYPQNMEIAHFKGGASHYLINNKFMIKPGHIILSADSPEKKQGDLLEKSDFIAISRLFSSFDGKGIVYYNSGKESGHSQSHKHIQYVPIYETPLFDRLITNWESPIIRFYSPLKSLSAPALEDSYKNLMSQMKRKTRLEKCSYNFIISKNNALMVPRKRSRHINGVSMNSLGLCGHFFLWERKRLLMKKPLSIISDLCYLQEKP